MLVLKCALHPRIKVIKAEQKDQIRKFKKHCHLKDQANYELILEQVSRISTLSLHLEEKFAFMQYAIMELC